MLVNIWNLEGHFVLGGIFNSTDAIVDALAALVDVSPSTKWTIINLWKENSRYGIPDYSNQFKISIMQSRVRFQS